MATMPSKSTLLAAAAVIGLSGAAMAPAMAQDNRIGGGADQMISGERASAIDASRSAAQAAPGAMDETRTQNFDQRGTPGLDAPSSTSPAGMAERQAEERRAEDQAQQWEDRDETGATADIDPDDAAAEAEIEREAGALQERDTNLRHGDERPGFGPGGPAGQAGGPGEGTTGPGGLSGGTTGAGAVGGGG